jgi:hypothetical protein
MSAKEPEKFGLVQTASGRLFRPVSCMSQNKRNMQAVRINHRWKNILSLMSERVWVSIEDVLPLVPNLKYARRIMRNLMNLGLVKHTQCSLPFQSRGPGMNFYALQSSASRFFDTPINEPKIPTSTHLYHYYITNTVLTGITILSNTHDGFVVNCAAEKELRSMCQEFNKTDFSSQRTGIPDFAFCIGTKDRSQLFLGEVDAETETISNKAVDSNTIANKFDGIKRSAKLGLLKTLSNKFSFDFTKFSYLIITSGDESRAKRIIEETVKCNPTFPVYVSCFADFNSYEQLIERVWYSINGKTVSILEEI